MHNVFLVALFSCCLLATVDVHAGGYQNADEGIFSANLPNMLQALYRTPLPASAPASCVVGSFAKYNGGVPTTTTLPANSRLSAAQVQSTCGLNSACQLPASSTLVMDSSLSVATLRIFGSLIWTDETQAGQSLTLCTGSLIVDGGNFTMIVTQVPAYIYIQDNGAYDTEFGYRSFGGYNNPKVVVQGRAMPRTWSLLSSPAQQKASSISLMHDPVVMGWRVGDRVQLAPTTKGSTGTAETYWISGISNNTVMLSNTSDLQSQASLGQRFAGSNMYLASDWAVSTAAEVINLSRTIVITGDDFKDIACVNPTTDSHTAGCLCDGSVPRTKCTMGLHTALRGPGLWNMQAARLELCGQRGVKAHYCQHLHMVGYCPNCVLSYNAIEGSMQRGSDIHGTHASQCNFNVYTAVRGSNVFIEDGNEMYNHVEYNVAICPWALDGPLGGCTIPGTDNGQGDTSLNQAGFWATSFQNYLIGNRAANSFNGMLYDAQGFEGGIGGAQGKECLDSQLMGRLEGNTFHGHGRFGTYILVNIYPKKTDRTLAANGFITNKKTCDAFDSTGQDLGVPQLIQNSFDYQNTFVGQYGSGDIQYHRHASINNDNGIYWKETKTFQDGCSAHLSDSYYADSNMALPGGLGAYIIEGTTFSGGVTFECSHHCNVGTTGMMCMSTYMFSNVNWQVTPAPFVWPHWGENNGAMFTLGPDECAAGASSTGNSPFPAGYCSLANPFWTYLTSVDSGATCTTPLAAGMSSDIDKSLAHGILCKKGLRHLQVLSVGQKNLTNNPGPMNIEVWQNGAKVGSQSVPYFQIGDDQSNTGKQGWSFTVMPGSAYQYRLALASGQPIPTTWTIIFSDPVISNRWPSYPDELNLLVQGRTCPSVTSGRHDRLWIWGGSPDSFLAQPGRGACTNFASMPTIDCATTMTPAVKQGMYIENTCAKCAGVSCKGNSYCDCGTSQCICQPGFSGPSCESDICACVGCDTTKGSCAARYLGGTQPPTQAPCGCKAGVFGDRCNADPCKTVSCGAHGTCQAISATTAVCQCAAGYQGAKCDATCDTVAHFKCAPPCINGMAFYPDADFSGGNLQTIRTDSYQACGDACIAMGPTCGGLAWFTGTCYLKGVGGQLQWSPRSPDKVYGGVQCNVTDITGGKSNEPVFVAPNQCIPPPVSSSSGTFGSSTGTKSSSTATSTGTSSTTTSTGTSSTTTSTGASTGTSSSTSQSTGTTSSSSGSDSSIGSTGSSSTAGSDSSSSTAADGVIGGSTSLAPLSLVILLVCVAITRIAAQI